ncbi:AraC family transcriptional regulator [Pseudohoeflea suaedae]|uniref:AraC family transcriptional regulator n=1 Tax=Pseudohoeflea suaedae TaxID=877384 RepID=A0A4R5PLA7_9HYPH|nr:AraC family transcriptional regulator [Pseudohoeflea suaedae]TDH37649.1 AraC family transcriptional regulator [Pseudohoeflea suaedae]
MALASLIAREIESDQPFHERHLDGLVDGFLTLLFDIRLEPERRRPALSEAQLRQAMAYIDAHCLETIRLSDLAGEVGLSETYFSHAFKAAAGVSPHRWVMQERVRRAQTLLREGDQPVSWVAAQCGFADQAHFSRVFRSVTGMTPGAWKREQ